LRRDFSGSPEELAERRNRAGILLHEALKLRRELDDRRGLAETLNNLGVLFFEMEDLGGAWRWYREALEYERQLDHLHGIGVALANLGEAAGDLGAAELGASLLAASVVTLAEAGSPVIEDVGKMLDEMASRAGWSASDLNERLERSKAMETNERCDCAMADAANFPSLV
jgi:tetratricopeptide (TPR) repeat protein